MAKKNYSDCRFRLVFDAGLLSTEFLKYNSAFAKENYEYVLEYNDIRKQEDKYLEPCQ